MNLTFSIPKSKMSLNNIRKDTYYPVLPCLGLNDLFEWLDSVGLRFGKPEDLTKYCDVLCHFDGTLFIRVEKKFRKKVLRNFCDPMMDGVLFPSNDLNNDNVVMVPTHEYETCQLLSSFEPSTDIPIEVMTQIHSWAELDSDKLDQLCWEHRQKKKSDKVSN